MESHQSQARPHDPRWELKEKMLSVPTGVLRLSGKPRDSHLVPHGKTGRGLGPAQSEAGLTQGGSLSFRAVRSPELRLLPLQPENPPPFLRTAQALRLAEPLWGHPTHAAGTGRG